MAELREPREIFLVGIQTISKDGKIGGGPCAGIDHAGRPWLVPQWIENREEQVTMPERIICLDGLPYQRGGDLGAIELKYILNFPIPMTVLYEEIPPEQSFGLVVEMHPDIKFRGVGLDRTRL